MYTAGNIPAACWQEPGVCGGSGGWGPTAGGCEDWETAVRGQSVCHSNTRPNVTSQADQQQHTLSSYITSPHLRPHQRIKSLLGLSFLLKARKMTVLPPPFVLAEPF